MNFDTFERIISNNTKDLQDEMHTLNDEQKNAMLKMMMGKNCFITGDAGVGKSYVIKLFNKWCEEGNRHLLKTAPTGKASVNIGGVTAHSLFGLPLRTEEMIQPTTSIPKKVERNLRFADRIVIDECSMLRIDAFEKVMSEIALMNEKRAKHEQRPIQVILVGDFGQLPPVIMKDDKEILNKHYGKDIGNGYCFQSTMWKSMDFETISLKQIIRQEDKEFSEALTKCKYGDNSCIDYFNENFKTEPSENAIWLFGKNSSAFEKNQECMQKLPEKFRKIETEFSGEFTVEDGIVEKDLWLKKGCRLLITANDIEEMKYCNGSMGTLKHIGYDTLIVRLDDTEEDVEIPKKVYEKKDYKPETVYSFEKKPVLDANGSPILDANGNPKTKEEKVEKQVSKLVTIGTATQFPVKVGYAITVHKSQGMTFDKVNYKPEVFAEGQFYVAMSRCKDIHNLYCEGSVTPRMVKTANEFLKFIKNPNEYSFFTEKDIQRQENLKNGIDENQLSFDDIPEIPEIPVKKSGGFRLGSIKNKFQKDTVKEEPKQILEEKISNKSSSDYVEDKDLTLEDKEKMLCKLIDGFSKDRKIDNAVLKQLINSDSKIADAINDALIDYMVNIRKEIKEKSNENDIVTNDEQEFDFLGL